MKKWKQILLAEILLVAILLAIEKSLIIAFISIMIHECVHILMAKYKGSKFNSLEFHIYGARVELMDLEELSSKDKILIYLSGPMANLGIMSMFFVLNLRYSNTLISNIISSNLGLALFNLLPAYPLDGARVLEIILTRKIVYKKAQAIISFISYFIAVFFIFTSILDSVFMKNYNVSMLLAGIIIFDITRTEKKAVMYILMGSIFKKRKNIIKNNYIENKSISAYYKQGLVTLMANVDKNRFNIFYILDDELKLQYILYEDELIEALKEYGNITLEEYKDKRVGKG